MSRSNAYDVVILGAGSGGYAAALRASQLGLSVALIEANKVGGTCLHRGCIPTKAMLHTAELADQVRHAPDIGIEARLASIDIIKVGAFRDGVVNRLHRGLSALIKARGITLVEGIGRLVSATTVEVEGQLVVGRHIILATGSRPKTLPGLDIGGHIISSDQALKLEWIPRTAIILGGGVIGVEFASMWRSFGTDVTIVEALDRLVPNEDETVSKAIERALKRRGIKVKTAARLEGVTSDEQGVHAKLFDGTVVSADLLLVAVGRSPNTEGIGLKEVSVPVERGFVKVDPNLRTGIGQIWAVGDIVPGLQLAHRGFAQGVAVAERIAGRTVPPLIESGIPRVTYSDPEIASVGLTEAQARQQYGPAEIVIENQTLGGNARSLVLGTAGLVKVIRLAGGPVVGIHLVGARVGELIGEAQLIVNWEAQPEDVAPLIHAHPTQGEALGEALMALAGQPLHAHA